MIIRTLKLLTTASIVLIISQFPVKNRRICDHVGDYTTPLLGWAKKNVNFAKLHLKLKKKIKDKSVKEALDPGIDKESLSGVLKEQGFKNLEELDTAH